MMKAFAPTLAGLCLLAAIASIVLIVVSLRLRKYDLVATNGVLIVLNTLLIWRNLATWLAS